MKASMEKFNGIYGRSYTKKDENRENLIYGVKVLGAVIAVGLATVGIYATSEANKKLDALRKDFIETSISDSSKLNHIISERDKVLGEYGCLPQSWTKHKSHPSEFGNTICLNMQK